MTSVMQVSVFWVCRNVDGSLQLMSPPLQIIFLCIVFHIVLNQIKPHTIDTIYYYWKGVCHTHYNIEFGVTHENLLLE